MSLLHHPAPPHTYADTPTINQPTCHGTPTKPTTQPTQTRGQVIYATSQLAALLGHDPKAMERLEFAKLMAQPFAQLHARWLEVG
jgi:hypothetical protein